MCVCVWGGGGGGGGGSVVDKVAKVEAEEADRGAEFPILGKQPWQLG